MGYPAFFKNSKMGIQIERKEARVLSYSPKS
jgi:hypothetical protein